MSTVEPNLADSLGLAPNEAVGVIVAIVSVGTVLVLLVLVTIMVCKYVWHKKIKRNMNMMHESQSFTRSGTRASKRSQRISMIVADASERPSTTNTFNIDSKPLADAQKTSPFPPPPENVFPDHEEIELLNPKQDLTVNLKSRQLPRSDLLLLEKLGEGEYGPIYRGDAYNLGVQDQSRPVTVKMLAQQETDENRAMFNNDIEMLTSIGHLNVVTMLAVCTEDSPECVLLDAGMPGDLLTFIRNKKSEISSLGPTVDETYHLLKLADEISIGMAYLTSERFVHKDLSLRNCIIGYDGVVKVAHFGLGPVLYPEAYYRVHDIDLPIRWMSPEAITSTDFTSASDVWAFGVVLYELFSYGDLPYQDRSNEEVITYVVREFGKLERPSRCPEDVFKVALSCWFLEPNTRLSFPALHDHIFNLTGQTEASGSLSTSGSSPLPIPSSETFEAETNFH